MGGSKINGGGGSCGGNDSGNNGGNDNNGGGSDGKSNGDGDRRHLMDAMIKVPSDKSRQI